MTSIESGSASNGKTNNQKKQDEILLQPYSYILENPGKQIRSHLVKAFNFWLNVPQDKLSVIGDTVEMLHNASLLIDDIEDDSKLRRGYPVAHSIFGIASSINSANYAYFLSLKKAISLDHPDIARIFTQQMLEAHRGQGIEIHWRDKLKCPSEEEYRKMVIQKTGGLFTLAIKLMQLFSGNQSDFSPLVVALGLYFQIRDDYINLCSKDYSETKGYCEDLTEGKFSFPIIYAIKAKPEDNKIMNIVKQRTEDNNIKKYCVELLEKCRSFDYTKTVLQELDARAVEEIERLGGNPNLMAILNKLREW